MSRNYYRQPRTVAYDKPTTEFNCVLIPPLPADATVTMAYVPFQTDATVYDESKALAEGTLFPVLNKPFCAAGGCR